MATVFGITQAGRPCRNCLRMGGYCHQHTSQQPGGSISGGTRRRTTTTTTTTTSHRQFVQRRQPPSPDAHQHQRVFGYTQRGLPCKNCIRRGDFCHQHQDQRPGGVANRPPAVRVRSETTAAATLPSQVHHYGITLQGLPCKICIRKGGYCRKHEGQRQRASPPPVLQPPRTSPTTTRTSRPARVHDEERQRQIYGNAVFDEARNSPRQGRNGAQRQQPAEGRNNHVVIPNDHLEARNSPRQRRSVPTSRRHSVERSTNATTSGSGSPDRRASRRRSSVEGQSSTTTTTTTLNMSDRDMDEQFYRLLGLFSEYMRLVQLDEEEARRRNNSRLNGRASLHSNIGGDGFPDSNNAFDVTTEWGSSVAAQSHTTRGNGERITVGSLQESVNESVAAARRASLSTTPHNSSSRPSNVFARSTRHVNLSPPAVASPSTSPTEGVVPDEASSASRCEPECSICLEGLKNGPPPEFLACGHGFHGVCLEQWRSYSNCCPLCRCPTASPAGY